MAIRATDWRGLDRIFDEHAPVLLVSAHLGSWELFAEEMTRRGVLCSAVVRPLNGAFHEWVVRNRQAAGMELILQRGAIFAMRRALGRGRPVGPLLRSPRGDDAGRVGDRPPNQGSGVRGAGGQGEDGAQWLWLHRVHRRPTNFRSRAAAWPSLVTQRSGVAHQASQLVAGNIWREKSTFRSITERELRS